MCGWGRGQAGEVVFASDVCSKTPKVQVWLENLVHDCRFKALQVAVAVISSQSFFRKLIEQARFKSNLLQFTSFNGAKISKEVKNYFRKSLCFKNHIFHGSRKNRKPVSRGRKKKQRFTNHGKNKLSFTFHAKQKCPFTRDEKLKKVQGTHNKDFKKTRNHNHGASLPSKYPANSIVTKGFTTTNQQRLLPTPRIAILADPCTLFFVIQS